VNRDGHIRSARAHARCSPRIEAGSLNKGYFIEPTISTARRDGIFKEEIFGPVLSVATASSARRSAQVRNSVEYGLTTSIFTSDITS
jgi:aldehyde dehydrogenase (NAD+)